MLEFALDRTFFGENRYTFEHSKCNIGFTRYCADFGPKCARQRVNFADLLASVLDFREKPHTSVHSRKHISPAR